MLRRFSSSCSAYFSYIPTHARNTVSSCQVAWIDAIYVVTVVILITASLDISRERTRNLLQATYCITENKRTKYYWLSMLSGTTAILPHAVRTVSRTEVHYRREHESTDGESYCCTWPGSATYPPYTRVRRDTPCWPTVRWYRRRADTDCGGHHRTLRAAAAAIIIVGSSST